MMIFSIKLPFSSSLAVDEEPKNDSLMSNLETNLASFDTGPPSISLLTPDTHLGVENLNGWVWCDQPSSLLACTITWSHHVTLHNVTLTCLTSYSLSGARELKVKLPVNMTPSCLVTTCHSTQCVLTPGHLRALLVLVSAAWMMLVVHPVLTGLTGLYRILSIMLWCHDTHCVYWPSLTCTPPVWPGSPPPTWGCTPPPWLTWACWSPSPSLAALEAIMCHNVRYRAELCANVIWIRCEAPGNIGDEPIPDSRREARARPRPLSATQE